MARPIPSPDWSPDGRRIVFASGREGASAIYLLELATGAVSPLVVASRYDSLPKWTPDGRAVSFARSIDGVSRVMLVDVTSKQVRRLELGEVSADALAWWRGGLTTVPRECQLGSRKIMNSAQRERAGAPNLVARRS